MPTGTWQELMETEKAGVQDYTVCGRCSGCGACCSDFLPATEDEIKRIHCFIQTYGIKEQKHLGLSTSRDFTCPFRDERNRKCLIYEVRPEICRAFLCNQSRDAIDANKEKFHRQNKSISMRNEFFGNDINVGTLLSVVLEMAAAGFTVNSPDIPVASSETSTERRRCVNERDHR